MAKRKIGVLILTSVIILLPMLAGLALWNQLPDTIPFHWNLAGEVDYQAPKAVVIVAFPVLMLVLQWVSQLSAREGKRSGWVIPALTLIISAIVYYFSMI